MLLQDALLPGAEMKNSRYLDWTKQFQHRLTRATSLTCLRILNGISSAEKPQWQANRSTLKEDISKKLLRQQIESPYCLH